MLSLIMVLLLPDILNMELFPINMSVNSATKITDKPNLNFLIVVSSILHIASTKVFGSCNK